MARIWTLGAEEGSRKAMSDMVIVVGNSPTVVDQAPCGALPRTGNYLYSIGGTLSANVYDAIRIPIPQGIQEVYFGCALYGNGNMQAPWRPVVSYPRSSSEISSPETCSSPGGLSEMLLYIFDLRSSAMAP